MNNFLNAHYLQTGSTDFTQFHMNLIHGHDKKLLKCFEPWPYFQGYIGKETSKFRSKTFKCTFSMEWFDELYPNLHDLKPKHDKSWCGFVTLTLLFKVTWKKVKFRLKLIKCALSSERVSGYYLNFDEISIWLWQKIIKFLGPFSYFQGYIRKSC